MRLELHRPGAVLEADSFGEGPLVLAVHGFPDDARSFRRQVPALVDAGYRVLTPTLRGYLPGQAGPFDLRNLAADMLAWIDRCAAQQVVFVGHDWGALIGYSLATLAPQRVKALVTVAVPHLGGLGLRLDPMQVWRSRYMFLFQLNGLSERWLLQDDCAWVKRLWADWSPGWTPDPEDMASVLRTFQQPGVARASLGYYRALMRRWDGLRLLRAPVPVPTLWVGGERDGCVSVAMSQRFFRDERFPKGLRREVLPDAGHFVHQEQPQAFNRLMLDFLSGS